MSPVNSQFIRFAIVGLVSNFCLFMAYMILTYYGVSPKFAMSFLYVLGIFQTFTFNRKWTFAGCSTDLFSSGVKYFLLYGFGYLLNLFLLYIFVDMVGYSHLIVQGFAVLLLAVFFFVVQKFFVFTKPN